MSLRSDLLKQIELVYEGKSSMIPFPYEGVGEVIELSKNTMYTILGETGSGKSSLAQDLFIIPLLEWYINTKPENLKLSIIYFAMERKLFQYSSRWISRKIFLEQGMDISPKKILGKNKKYQMTPIEKRMVEEVSEILDVWEADDLFISFEGSKNPTGISKWLDAFAEKHGKVTHKNTNDESVDNILATKTYESHHPNHIVFVVTDHAGLVGSEKDASKSKDKMDKFSKIMREARDIYGWSPVIVQQMNRGLSDIHRQRMGELEPNLSDANDTSGTSHDSDVVLALYDPFRHLINGKVPEMKGGYDLNKFRDKKFKTFYRSLHILKNSFDASSMYFPMAFEPIRGIFKTLPKKDKVTEDIYEKVLSGQFFLEQTQESIEGQQPNKKAFSFNKK